MNITKESAFALIKQITVIAKIPNSSMQDHIVIQNSIKHLEDEFTKMEKEIAELKEGKEPVTAP